MHQTEHAPAEIEKWRAYFSNKQLANRASTKTLEKFFKARGETQPAEEVKAWERMAELIEEPSSEVVVPPEPVKPVTPDHPVEAPQAEEAPPERSVTLSTLKAMPAAFVEVALRAAQESLARGEPVKNIPRVVEAAGKQFFSSFSSLS